MSHPGYVSFFRQSQVMMSTEFLASIKILRTIVLATFISTTKGSLWGEVKHEASPLLNTMVGTPSHEPLARS